MVNETNETMQDHKDAWREQVFEMKANGLKPPTFKQYMDHKKRLKEFFKKFCDDPNYKGGNFNG